MMLLGIEPGFLTMVITLGALVGLGYYVLTWRNCGGTVTPGVLAALALLAPGALAKVAVAAALTYLVMPPILRRVFLSQANTIGLYVTVGLVISLVSELALNWALPKVHVVTLLGLVSPGLIAYYMRREGVVMTVLGTSSAAAMTALIALTCVQLTPWW
jgi:hypothetical protein